MDSGTVVVGEIEPSWAPDIIDLWLGTGGDSNIPGTLRRKGLRCAVLPHECGDWSYTVELLLRARDEVVGLRISFVDDDFDGSGYLWASGHDHLADRRSVHTGPLPSGTRPDGAGTHRRAARTVDHRKDNVKANLDEGSAYRLRHVAALARLRASLRGRGVVMSDSRGSRRAVRHVRCFICGESMHIRIWQRFGSAT